MHTETMPVIAGQTLSWPFDRASSHLTAKPSVDMLITCLCGSSAKTKMGTICTALQWVARNPGVRRIKVPCGGGANEWRISKYQAMSKPIALLTVVVFVGLALIGRVARWSWLIFVWF